MRLVPAIVVALLGSGLLVSRVDDESGGSRAAVLGILEGEPQALIGLLFLFFGGVSIWWILR